MDTSNLDLLNDFASDRAQVRMLEIECSLTDTYLTGHAMRIGLAGDQTSQETLSRLLPTIRGDMLHEVDLIRDAQFQNYTCLSENADTETNTAALARFLTVSDNKARAIAQTDNLFAD